MLILKLKEFNVVYLCICNIVTHAHFVSKTETMTMIDTGLSVHVMWVTVERTKAGYKLWINLSLVGTGVSVATRM